jgi:hypothetical protein
MLNEIKTDMALKQSELTNFLSNLSKAYSILGYNEKELDIENGGFLPKAEMEHENKQLKGQLETKKERIEILGVYGDKDNDKVFWAAVVTKPGLSKENVISIAKQLHSQDTEMQYDILDAKPNDFDLWKKFKQNGKLNHDLKRQLIVWTNQHEIASIAVVFKTNADGVITDANDLRGKWKLLPNSQYARNIHLEEVDL